MVRGYHVYKDIRATVVGEELPCQHEDGNRPDPFAVAVVRGGAIVGHVPSLNGINLQLNPQLLCKMTESSLVAVQ